MAVSTKSLSVVAFAFVAGVASTSAYMSRGGDRRDLPEATHGAAPSIAERLQAEAHGQSLPWSDPVKAAPVPAAHPRLQFTPGPTDAPVEIVKSVAGGERVPVLQATQARAPVRSPDEVMERPQIRLADRSLHGRPTLSVASSVRGTRSGSVEAPQRALDGASEHPRAQIGELVRRTLKPHPASSRNLPLLDAVDAARLSVRRSEPSRANLPAPSPYRTVQLAVRGDLDVDAPSARRSREARVEASDWPSDGEPRAKPRRSVAASDGLMRWLSGPDGRF